MAAFEFITSDEFRAGLEQDSEELIACMRAGAWKAAHVMAASLIQATLVHYLAASGKITEEEALRLSFAELLSICRAQEVLSPRTAELATFVRPYYDFLSPVPGVRMSVTADETSARIAQALLEIVGSEVSSHRREHFRLTAEQVVAKLRSDPSSTAIMGHLVGKIGRAELERLLTDLLPRAFLDTAKLEDPAATGTLQRLEQCHRLAFEVAPADLKRSYARHLVGVLEHENEQVVQCYQSSFFRASDLGFLDGEERSLAKTHFLASIEENVTVPLVVASAGIGAFLVTHEEAQSFFVPLVLSLMEKGNPARAAAVAKRVPLEIKLLAEPIRRGVGGWLERLHWSLRMEGRALEAEAMEPLFAALNIPLS